VSILRRHPVVTILLLLHFVVCGAFIVLREPSISHLEERERMRRESGYHFESSVDPIMFIAGRRLNGWNEWHGGERLWIKICEVANLPALAATVTVGHLPIAIYRATGSGTFVHDTWIRAFVFLLFSVVQWCLVGRFIERRMRWPRADSA
jgi:hypothetical protein